MANLTEVHTQCGILRSHKKAPHYRYTQELESLGHPAEWKKANLKCHILCDSTYIAFCRWQHDRNREQISGCQGQPGGKKGAGAD